jgi:hypothetical protein
VRSNPSPCSFLALRYFERGAKRMSFFLATNPELSRGGRRHFNVELSRNGCEATAGPANSRMNEGQLQSSSDFGLSSGVQLFFPEFLSSILILHCSALLIFLANPPTTNSQVPLFSRLFPSS